MTCGCTTFHPMLLIASLSRSTGTQGSSRSICALLHAMVGPSTHGRLPSAPQIELVLDQCTRSLHSVALVGSLLRSAHLGYIGSTDPTSGPSMTIFASFSHVITHSPNTCGTILFEIINMQWCQFYLYLTDKLMVGFMP